MTVAGLAVDASNQCPIVLLRDTSGRRQVPIWIDHAQAHSIMAGIQKTDSSRPLTHDLMVSMLQAGKLSLDRVVIHNIDEKMFKAVLKVRTETSENTPTLKDSNSLLELDARPSDAIALAVRSKCSIWMLENVVAEASIAVDAEADEADQNEFRSFLEEISPASLINHLKNKPNPGGQNIDLENTDSNCEE